MSDVVLMGTCCVLLDIVVPDVSLFLSTVSHARAMHVQPTWPY
jgi:hypothetical protein